MASLSAVLKSTSMPSSTPTSSFTTSFSSWTTASTAAEEEIFRFLEGALEVVDSTDFRGSAVPLTLVMAAVNRSNADKG